MIDEDAMAIFLAEAEGLVETLEEKLLALQTAPTDKALIDAVFRDLHTLKGSGAMFGRKDIASFLHDFETAFEQVRAGRVVVDADLITISLAARDFVAKLLDEANASGGDAILTRLKAHLDGGVNPATSDWTLTFTLPADTLSLGGRPEFVITELRDLGARDIQCHTGDVPDLDQIDPKRLYLSWTATIDGSVAEEDIREVFFFHEEGLSFDLTRPDQDIIAEPAEDPVAAPVSARDTSSLMRVPAERLDDLMDRVGELVIAEARLVEIASRLSDPALVAVAEDIQRLTTGMRDTTMSIRMTPIGAITGRFRRLVHDLSGRLDKPIDLIIEGEDTELDKTVVESLTEPLMHIIRNAADHGLETPEDRTKAGKDPTGQIRLSARYSGAEVLISLSDDGRGLNRDAILARAQANGLLPVGAMPDEDTIFGMIFEPGFSTTDAVTDLSGRGVGMDVVRRTVEDLRGSIEVKSEPGHGATVTLRLPLTLAIIDGLLVETANERFVIPLAAVDEIVELPPALAEDETGNAFLDIRDSLVPFLRLRSLLESPGTPDGIQKVVVVTSSEGRVGLVVDQIIGSNQTVIKQLSPLHAGLKTFSGATILGDGAVALILDVPHLVHRGRFEADAGREVA